MQDSTVQSVQLYFETLVHQMPMGGVAYWKRSESFRKKEISWQAVYHHWQKWNAAGCFEGIWQQVILCIKDDLDCTHLNLDGSHSIAKKGGETVVYQYRKRAKTSNILPITMPKALFLPARALSLAITITLLI